MADSFLRIVALTYKELLAILSDPRGRFTLFGPPVLQILIFGYAATYDLNDIPYAVVDEDRSAASREFLSRLDGSGVFHRAAELTGSGEAAAFLNSRRGLIVVRIGPDFERELQSGTPATIQVLADGRNSNTASIAVGYVTAVVEAFNADWRANAGLPAPPVRVVMRAWYNPNLETRWHMVPALIGTLTMLQSMLLTAMSVAREREQGTFDQLLVTPFRPAEIMVGKSLPTLMIGLTQATAILLVAQFWFEIPFAGSFLTLYAGLFLFLLAAVGIGLLLSSLVATMQQAMLFTFVLLMPFILLSGMTTPVSSMPESIQTLTLVNPLRYAVELIHRVYLEGAGLGRLIPQLWPLATIAAVTLSTASWMFRHRMT